MWKPEIIRRALDRIGEGEFLVYLDAGCTLHATPKSYPRFFEYIALIQESKYDVLSFAPSSGGHERCWTTNRIFDFFEAHSKSVANTPQFGATILVMRKGHHLRQWLALVHRVISSAPTLAFAETSLLCLTHCMHR